MRARPLLLLALLALAGTTPLLLAARGQDPAARPPRRQLHCGALLAVPGQAPLRERTLVVRGGKIEQVLEGWVQPGALNVPAEEAEVIDLRRAFVLPGLIDCHVHLTSEYSAKARLEAVELSDADRAVRGAGYARRTLLAGFTTVRDLGSSGDAAFALRDGIRQGFVPGPRILAAGESITPTGGHSDGTLGYREELFSPPGAMEGVGDGVPGCRQAVRAQVKRGADVIKVTATGGVLSTTAAGTGVQFHPDELEAIVSTARLLGRKVAAHAHGADGIKAALRAGVDSIEHGTYLDEEAIALFKERRAFLVPTIIAGKSVAEWAERPGFFPEPVVEKARAVGPIIQGAFGRAWKAGVRIAFGTDCGVSAHGQNARELGYMVEAGMPPMEALVAATVNAAELCGLPDVGTLQPGKQADVIATAASPLDDVAALSTVVFVMREGEVYRR